MRLFGKKVFQKKPKTSTCPGDRKNYGRGNPATIVPDETSVQDNTFLRLASGFGMILVSEERIFNVFGSLQPYLSISFNF